MDLISWILFVPMYIKQSHHRAHIEAISIDLSSAAIVNRNVFQQNIALLIHKFHDVIDNGLNISTMISNDISPPDGH